MTADTMSPFICSCFSFGLLCCIAGFQLNVSSNDVSSTGHTKGCVPRGSLDINITYEDMNDNGQRQIEVLQERLYFTNSTEVKLNCMDGQAQMTILSKDGRFEIVVSFMAEDKTKSGDMYIDDVAVLINTNLATLHDISKRRNDEPSRSRPPILKFETAVNRTSDCDPEQTVYFHSKQAHASLVFSRVRLQPFDAVDKKIGDRCVRKPPRNFSTKHAAYLVPVILAVSLIVVLSLMVTGFIVHKKIESLGYTSMT